MKIVKSALLVLVGLWMQIPFAIAGSVKPLTDAEREQARLVNSVFRRAAEQVGQATVFIHVSKGEGFTLSEGLGSGVIIDPQGFVVTNNHVVKDTDRVEVLLSDGRRFEAEEIMLDPDTDLAVVYFNPKGQDIPVAKFGNSDELQVGDFVLAIGSPFGLEQTVTVGTVSYLGRRTNILDNKWGYEDFIQTDAVINKGNSGGPLVDLYGQVVGINSNILSPTGVSAGYGFAIPSKIAEFVVKELMEHKVVRRGYLGVSMHQMTIAELMQLPARTWDKAPAEQAKVGEFIKGLPDNVDGVLVVEVQDDTPAAQAGMQQYDIITAMNGEPMTSSKMLRNQIAMMPPETQVHFTVWRDGSVQEMDVVLADRSAAKKRDIESYSLGSPYIPDFGPNRMLPPFSLPGAKPRLGVSVQMADDELANAYGFPSGTQGVIIVGIVPGSLAQKHELKAGEIIRTINGQEISSVEQLRERINQTDFESEALTMELESPGGIRTVTVGS